MRLIPRALAPLLLTLGLTTAVPAANAAPVEAAPLYAGTHNIRHYSPDSGYDAPITIGTAWSNGTMTGRVYSIGEGYSRGDVAAFYVAAGTDVVCTPDGVSWSQRYTQTGWQKSYSSATCVNQTDSSP